EILTGRPPFPGGDTAEVLRQVREQPPTPPRRINPRAPRSLEAVCLRALAKAPEQRYESTSALEQEVRRFLADEPVAAYREPLGPRLMRWARRHRSWAMAGVAALVVATLVSAGAAVAVERMRRVAETGQRAAARLAADMAIERGLALCEQGDAGRGALFLTQ